MLKHNDFPFCTLIIINMHMGSGYINSTSHSGGNDNNGISGYILQNRTVSTCVCVCCLECCVCVCVVLSVVYVLFMI